MTTSTLPLLRTPTLFLSIQTYDLVALMMLLIAPLSPTQVMKKGSWIWAQGCQQEGKVVGYGDGSVVDRQGCEGHNAQLKVAVVGAWVYEDKDNRAVASGCMGKEV